MNHVHLFGFVLILAVFPNESFSQNPDLITKTCDKSLHKELCNSILRSLPVSGHVELHVLAKLILEVELSTGLKIREHLTELSKRHLNVDNFIKTCLAKTAMNYVRASEEIHNSIVALSGKKYDEVNKLVTAAMTNLDTCGENVVYDPALLTMTEVFMQIGSIESEMIKLLVSGKN